MGRFASIVVLSFIFINSVYSQGMYLSKEYGLSAGFLYGGGSEYNKIGFSAAFTLYGLLDFQYNHSKFKDDNSNNSFQNEYFIRAYLLKGKPYFFSAAVGYVTHNTEIELWRGFPLKLTNKGLALEAGLHLTSSNKEKNPKIISSIYYRYYNPEEVMNFPNGRTKEMKQVRSIMFELAVVFYYSKFCFVIGPRFSVENNFKDRFYGVNLSVNFKH
ncbi:MAG: hypothetical protein HND52_00260 [Ignavibacteriae bacterium]|nr:hypothetical protein [Ignavibacteriota bacterium]NOG96379.1 hypothetical protein [Ignavibacteriota bacterium]